ncbi:phosphatidylethanolamine-binding protein [Pseudomassariella vexata]|uniref:Phosphatidylethanolamine-binding protein n=1 Tax=Pseudomassariella vexata TaxID=1141098 RepID=A0A1Y2EEK9_9PEZI|nr:phosphatidylethanolamine-binding protein [Pseudomassariella vexata]ORY69847.1 phosphatidylethanolamine-binding protein [Pseudomassariella vexata]
MLPIVEVTLAWLFKNAKGRDAKAFQTGPAFADFAEPTVEITSTDCGPTNAHLGVEYTADGAGKAPALSWTPPPAIAAQVKEWLLVSEDPDAPLSTPIVHGLFGGIAATKTSVEAKDFEIEDKSKALLKGGFHYGKTWHSVPYVPPRPLMNHGPHRYFFTIIALKKPLDTALLNSKATTREQIADAIVGKVLGWGIWVGSCERVWK